MPAASFEHVNVTVDDPDRIADLLVSLFGWRRRWAGPSMNGGRTVHVGTEGAYVALYAPGETEAAAVGSYRQRGGLNHIGVVVHDLDAADQAVRAAGYETFSHQVYEPGRRFYFRDRDDIEFEVVSYA
jgi:catechol 2,3-dioxygenase-like lactoylglutathione lyase family enzyme